MFFSMTMDDKFLKQCESRRKGKIHGLPKLEKYATNSDTMGDEEKKA